MAVVLVLLLFCDYLGRGIIGPTCKLLRLLCRTVWSATIWSPAPRRRHRKDKTDNSLTEMSQFGYILCDLNALITPLPDRNSICRQTIAIHRRMSIRNIGNRKQHEQFVLIPFETNLCRPFPPPSIVPQNIDKWMLVNQWMMTIRFKVPGDCIEGDSFYVLAHLAKSELFNHHTVTGTTMYLWFV